MRISAQTAAMALVGAVAVSSPIHAEIKRFTLAAMAVPGETVPIATERLGSDAGTELLRRTSHCHASREFLRDR